MWFIVEKIHNYYQMANHWRWYMEFIWDSVNNLVHDFTYSIANPLELLHSCTEPLICSQFHPGCGALEKWQVKIGHYFKWGEIGNE